MTIRSCLIRFFEQFVVYTSLWMHCRDRERDMQGGRGLVSGTLERGQSAQEATIFSDRDRKRGGEGKGARQLMSGASDRDSDRRPEARLLQASSLASGQGMSRCRQQVLICVVLTHSVPVAAHTSRPLMLCPPVIDKGLRKVVRSSKVTLFTHSMILQGSATPYHMVQKGHVLDLFACLPST